MATLVKFGLVSDVVVEGSKRRPSVMSWVGPHHCSALELPEVN